MSHEGPPFRPPSEADRPERQAPRYYEAILGAAARFLRGSQGTGATHPVPLQPDGDCPFETHRILDPAFFRDKDLLSDEGAEHKVFLEKGKTPRVVKYTWPGTFGFVPRICQGAFSIESATVADYFRRTEIQNQIFGDDIRIEGAVSLPYEKGVIDPIGETGWSVVISQRFHRGSGATEEAIAQFLSENGFFKAQPRNVWYRPQDGVLLSDAHPGNFIAIAGDLVPIDLHLNQVPPSAFTEAGWPS